MNSACKPISMQSIRSVLILNRRFTEVEIVFMCLAGSVCHEILFQAKAAAIEKRHVKRHQWWNGKALGTRLQKTTSSYDGSSSGEFQSIASFHLFDCDHFCTLSKRRNLYMKFKLHSIGKLLRRFGTDCGHWKYQASYDQVAQRQQSTFLGWFDELP